MLSTGLKCHPKSGVYYLRRRIPSDLLTCYPGKAEVTFSLRTKNYPTAVERHRLEETKLTIQWAERRRHMAESEASHQVQTITRVDSLTPDAIEKICQHAEAAALASDETRRASDDPYPSEEIEFSKAGYAQANNMLKEAVGQGKPFWSRAVIVLTTASCWRRCSPSSEIPLRDGPHPRRRHPPGVGALRVGWWPHWAAHPMPAPISSTLSCALSPAGASITPTSLGRGDNRPRAYKSRKASTRIDQNQAPGSM